MQRWFIVGDSHLAAFKAAAANGDIELPCEFRQKGGATAVGLRNPNSISDAIGLFTQALLPVLPDTVPVIHLGEVDCGYLIWYRAQKFGETVETQTEESITASFGFVDLLLSRGYDRVVLAGATLPTIPAGQDLGEVANARKDVTASLADRTALTLHYNQRLQQGAAERGLAFIDIAALIINPTTSVVDDAFRHPDPHDHHLDPDKAGRLWAAELNRLGRLWRP